MIRFNGKTLFATMRNLILVGGIMMLSTGCGDTEIPGVKELKGNLNQILRSLSDAISKVAKDPKSAESVIADLSKANEGLSKALPMFEKMPKAGKDQISAPIREGLAMIKKQFDSIKDKVELPKFKELATEVLKNLSAFAGGPSSQPTPPTPGSKDAPAKDAPAKDAPAKDAPAKDAPAKDAPAKGK